MPGGLGLYTQLDDDEAAPTLASRLAGTSASLALHLAGFALGLILASRPGASSPAPRDPVPEIVSLSALDEIPISPADQVLIEEPMAPAGADDSLEMGAFAFDLTKIRARKTSLFPFLTADLLFLARVDEQVRAARQRLTNPFASRRTDPSRPPLALSARELQQTVDRSWSRRERWQRFAEIADMVERHDSNEGSVPELVRQYLDQNILQPFCDAGLRDPRYWAMLENAADHADFIDFARRFVREHPFGRTTTELLFLVDELAQGSRDVLLMVLDTNPERDLHYTAAANPAGHELAIELQRHYAGQLWDRGLDSPADVRAHYDNLRLRLLSTIAEATPHGYRAGDARFLAGEIAFERGRREDAERWWRGIVPDRRDSYFSGYTPLLDLLARPGAASPEAIRRILRADAGRWRMASLDRLRQFGSRCDRF